MFNEIIDTIAPIRMPKYVRKQVYKNDPPNVVRMLRRDFFLISNDQATLHKLLNNFDSGYMVDSIDKAINILMKIVIQDYHPSDAIIIDSAFTNADLAKLRRFLRQQTMLNKIPLILLAEGDIPGETRNLLASGLVDDMFDLSNNNGAMLLKKIEFLKKIKERQLPMQSTVAEENAKGITGIYFGKRVFDIIVSLTLIMLLLPVFAIIAGAIWVESRGPILYISKRAGKNYKVFDFYKFRSMKTNADTLVKDLMNQNQYVSTDSGNASPVFFKLKNDPRVTRVGTILRNTSLDELPQLFNVLKGDMSLVGNRPLPLYEAATLTTDEFAERFMAPAGITGLWQVKKRGKSSEMSIEERMELDIEYARHFSFMYDLRIMISTPWALVQKENV